MNKKWQIIAIIIGSVIGSVIGLGILWLLYKWLGFEITVLLYLVSTNFLLTTISKEIKEIKKNF